MSDTKTEEIVEERITKEDVDKGVPAKVPSIIELKKILPSHCFSPDLSTSFYYVFRDLATVAALYLSMLVMELQPFPILKYMYMPVYWFFQGTLFASIFCLGHDCGHESFSNSRLINDTVGNIMHSIILVPYYPWKLTHRHHHKNNANIDQDEVFFPVRESELKEKGYLIPYFGLGIGWFGYMFTGYKPRAVPHLNPWHPTLAKHFFNCCISISLMALWTLFVVIPYGNAYGYDRLFVHYLMPVFGFGCWIVFITFLHHHDENVPWYADSKWDFVRGQLSSIDRHYGFLHDTLHNIGTHQIHHLFSKIPHYHLEEATKVFREHYPELVRKSSEPLIPTFMKMFHLYDEQCMITDDTLIHTYATKKEQ